MLMNVMTIHYSASRSKTVKALPCKSIGRFFSLSKSFQSFDFEQSLNFLNHKTISPSEKTSASATLVWLIVAILVTAANVVTTNNTKDYTKGCFIDIHSNAVNTEHPE